MDNAPDSPGRPVRSRPDLFTVFLMAACVVLAVLVFLLARENRRLKAGLSAQAAVDATTGALSPGECLTPFTVTSSTGAASSVVFGEGQPRTLFLVFSSRCPACATNLPIWNDGLARGLPPDLRLLPVQLDAGDAAAGPAPPLRWPVCRFGTPAPEFVKRIPFVPATVLVSGDGAVIRAWVGVLSEEQLEEIRREAAAPAGSSGSRCGV